jgi:hypothetical protein
VKCTECNPDFPIYSFIHSFIYSDDSRAPNLPQPSARLSARGEVPRGRIPGKTQRPRIAETRSRTTGRTDETHLIQGYTIRAGLIE